MRRVVLSSSSCSACSSSSVVIGSSSAVQHSIRFFGAKVSSGRKPEDNKLVGESGPRWTTTIPNIINKHIQQQRDDQQQQLTEGGAGATADGENSKAVLDPANIDQKTIDELVEDLGPVHTIGSKGHEAALMAWEKEKNLHHYQKAGAGYNIIERQDERDGQVKVPDRGTRPGKNSGMYRKWEDEPELEDLDYSIPQVNCAFIADLLAKRKKEQAAQWGDIDPERRKQNVDEKREEREREKVERGEATLGSKATSSSSNTETKDGSKNENNENNKEEEEEPLEDPMDYDEVRNLALHPTDGIMLMDVRTVAEITSWGTIEGAKIVPMHEFWEAFHLEAEEFEEQYGFDMPDKNQTLLFFCHHGPRSLMAAQIAHHLGYKNIIHLNGGFYEWSKQFFLLCRRWMVHDYTTGINDRRMLEFETAKHIAEDIAPEFNELVEAETELIRIDHTRSVGEKELPIPENVKQLTIAFEAERDRIELGTGKEQEEEDVRQLAEGQRKIAGDETATSTTDAEGKAPPHKQQQQQQHKQTPADDKAELQAAVQRDSEGVDPVLSNAPPMTEDDFEKQEELIRRDYFSEAAKVLRRRKASERTGIPESFMFRRKEQPHGTGR